jgi:hypothetical protein
VSRFVIVHQANADAEPAHIVETLDEARRWIRAFVDEEDPPLTERDRRELEIDLSNLSEDFTMSVKGSDTYKEWFYVSPLEETAPAISLSASGTGQ